MNKNQPWSILRFKGTGSWNDITLSATAVVDGTSGTGKKVKLTSTTHNLTAGSAITISATDNYNGTWLTLPDTATTLIYIPARFVDETTSTDDKCKFTLAPGCAFEFGGFKLKLSAVGGTASENMTITVDAKDTETVYDYQLYSQAMEAVQYLNWNIQDNPEPFEKSDELDFAWANAASKTYGLEIYWRRR